MFSVLLLLFDQIGSSIVYWISSLTVPLICIYCTDVNKYIDDAGDIHSYIGVTLGITSVLFGQIMTILYDVYMYPLRLRRGEVIFSHLSQFEGTILLSLYLFSTWHFRMLPISYYSTGFKGIIIKDVFVQLLVQDFYQYIAHRIEHAVPIIYKNTHCVHHTYIKPSLFDAFHGSCTDTIFMIIIPLFCTAHTVHTTNLWSYIAFGTIYANWLVLIHAEYEHPWDYLFQSIGFGTPRDHLIHHQRFKCNYGHLFMYWDSLFGSYTEAKN